MEDVRFDKITRHISVCSKGLSVDPSDISHSVVKNMSDGIETSVIDDMAANVCMERSLESPDYQKVACRLIQDNIRKMAPNTFTQSMSKLASRGLVHPKFMAWVKSNSGILNQLCRDTKDVDLDYFGLRTLLRSYLTTFENTVVESPVYLFMRVAVAVHYPDLDMVKYAFSKMTEKTYTHATPTLFNAGSQNQQCSSCFLMGMHEDSLEEIARVWTQITKISKWAGGIGLHVHKIRAKGSLIRKTNGLSEGIIPMLRVINNIARYVNQGGKRKGSVAVYLEPWHKDVMDFLALRLNEGDPEHRCRDLYTALWIPDMFMRRVKNDEHWTLMCPDEAPGLPDVWGEEWDKLYTGYEDEGIGIRVRARDVWAAILKSVVETGTPYICFKDTANRCNNQKHTGTLMSSNLCTEIYEPSSSSEVAVCNLGSISLSSMVEGGVFRFDKLAEITEFLVRSLDNVIDINFYPTEETKNSNMRHRPIGIGVQGLADVFMMLNIPYDSDEARVLNKKIFETIYYHALNKSNLLASERGAYESFAGSEASKGKLQFDLSPHPVNHYAVMEDKWDELKARIVETGLRNSLLVAPMPTASTAQILGNNEAFEPYTSNMYIRRTSAGEFIVMNQHLVKRLTELGMWNQDTRDIITRDSGSVRNLNIPEHIKSVFKTVWEIKQRHLIDMAADRQQYICQGQSLNLFLEDPSNAKVSSMLMYSWESGLKTGMYYLRTRPASKAQQVTLDPERFGSTNCEACSA